MRKKKNPKEHSGISLLDREARNIYYDSAYVDLLGRSTPLTHEELEEYEYAVDLIEKGSKFRNYDDYWPYFAKANTILRRIHDYAQKRHRTITIPKSMRAGKRNPKRK